jgi:hypothetical protein
MIFALTGIITITGKSQDRHRPPLYAFLVVPSFMLRKVEGQKDGRFQLGAAFGPSKITSE